MNKALKLIRVFHQKSQKDLAKALDVSPAHLCEIEKGKKKVSLDILKKYSAVFDIPVSSLMYFSEQTEGNKTIKPVSKKIIKILEWLDLSTR